VETGYLLAFTTGLLGGFGHCIGMCGPVVGAWSLRTAASSRPGRVLPQVLYHAGRIMTYGLVGAAMGLAGSFVDTAGRLAGVQQAAMVLAGIVMVVMGLGICGIGGTGWLERHHAPVLRLGRSLLGRTSEIRFLLLGLVLGLLPCGLSYTLFIAAAGTGSATQGLLTMLAFGAGTIPALGLFSVAVAYLGSRFRTGIQKAGGVAVILMGLLYIGKGIRLYAEM
jgi:sulfite exporter TauE/SafE